jgi:hypothetical protein
MKHKTTWCRGDKRRLAALARCNYTHLIDIIAGRKICPPMLAPRLEAAAATLGYRISRAVWTWQDLRRGNPLFTK